MDDRVNKPEHIGDAARRLLERLKRTSGQLSTQNRQQYDCDECKDTGLIEGEQGARRCSHIKQAEQKQDREKFF